MMGRKVCFISDAGNWGGEGGRHLSKGHLPPSAPYPRIGNQWTGAFIDRSGEAALCRNNTVSSDSHLQIDHQWSGQHYVGYLGTVILQFQGPLVPISLQSLLRIVAAHVLSTVWSSSS